MCSSVFITCLDPAFAAENVGYFTAPYEVRAKLGVPKIDREKRTVEVRMPNGVVRTAKQVGSQGCVTLPIGKTDVFFKPTIVKSKLPDAKTQQWPMGDLPPPGNFPPEINRTMIQQAVEAAFDPRGMTAARRRVTSAANGRGTVPVRHLRSATPLESWSMGKSLTGTLMGVLIKQGAHDLRAAGADSRMATPGDPRVKISDRRYPAYVEGSGSARHCDPDFLIRAVRTWITITCTGIDSFKYAATRPLQWPPNTVGRYRNTDPVLTNYLIRLAVEKRNEDYHSFPQRALFDKIGIRTMVLDTDPYGNFLTQGYEQGSARDWARLGNLYLQDGVWNGERILPVGYVFHARSRQRGQSVHYGFF
jgi:hypothetical protein